MADFFAVFFGLVADENVVFFALTFGMADLVR